MTPDPLKIVRGWLELPPEDRVMTLVEDGSFSEWVRMLVVALDAHREAAKAARSAAAAPDYDEEAIRGALWALVDLVLADSYIGKRPL